VKQRERGFDDATYVESFLVLNAAGGDCLEDFDQLRADAGLCELLGHAVPSAEAARKFLYQFHDGEKIEQAQQALVAGRVSYIPEESPALQGLAQVNQDVVRELGRRCAEQKIATWMWTPRSSKVGSEKPSPPVRAARDISRCWPYGRR
jgi:hypothetical protein